jgi:hypothetical protein
MSAFQAAASLLPYDKAKIIIKQTILTGEHLAKYNDMLLTIFQVKGR